MLNPAVGCSNLIPPDDAWIKREDDKIIIGCYTSRQTWQLRCHDGRWTGVVSNCSHGTYQGNYTHAKVIVNIMLRSCCSRHINNVTGLCDLFKYNVSQNSQYIRYYLDFTSVFQFTSGLCRVGLLCDNSWILNVNNFC